MSQKDFLFDTYIKERVSSLNANKHMIEPSKHFARQVMSGVMKLERRRTFTKTGVLCLLAMVPFAIRMIWEAARNDYFSVAQMPLGSSIYSVYHVLMAPVLIYVSLSAGIGLAVFLFTRYRPHAYRSQVLNTR